MRFDPMTGEPIVEEPVVEAPITEVPKAEEPVRKFDPMTGKPMVEETTPVPVEENKKSGKLVKILAIVAVVVIAVAVSLTTIVPRIVLGKNHKIISAFAKTMKLNHLMENANILDIVKDGNVTVSLSGEVEGIDVNLSSAVKKNASSVSGEIEGQEFAVLYEDYQLYATLPDYIDETLYYAFNGENDGALIDLCEENGIDIEAINEAVVNSNYAETSKELQAALLGATTDVVKNLDFNKADKRKVEINGKDRNCKGYMLVVDEDCVSDICDVYEDALEEYIEQTEELAELLDNADYDMGDVFSDIRDSAEDMEEIEIIVYLYKGQVAAIDMECDGEEVAIELRGGNVPWENTVVLYEDDEVMELKGSVDKGVEKLKLVSEGYTPLEYTYDTKSGALELEMNGTEIEGTLLKSGSKVEFSVDHISAYGDDADIDMVFTIKKGADMADVDKTEIFDIGNASMGDLMDFAEDNAGALQELYYLF